MLDAFAVYSTALARAPYTAFQALFDGTVQFIGLLVLLAIDGLYFALNVVLPKRRRGEVIAQGMLGEGGIWPQFIPPREGDSRSPCPALNALANHGILPHNGRNLSRFDLSIAIQTTFNTNWTVPTFILERVSRRYGRATFDLSDFCAHNVGEHDGSLTRHDFHFQPDQNTPSLDLVARFLTLVQGNHDKLSPALLSRAMSIRRIQSRVQNRHFYLTRAQRWFGSANGAMMLSLIGRDYKTLKVWLEEERIPDGWEPRCRDRLGFSLLDFCLLLGQIELGTKRNLPRAVVDSY